MLTVKQAKSFTAFNGTSLKGYVDADYFDLVDCFGTPTSDGDGYKVDAEWLLNFSDGTVATIYNYKDGMNYCGEAGLPVEDITDWHVGGHTPKALRNVEAMLAAHYAKQTA